MPSERSDSDTPGVHGRSFARVAHGERHSIGLDANGKAYSWGLSNGIGQLGRKAGSNKTPGPVEFGSSPPTRLLRAFVSDSKESDVGHSALLDDSGMLWTAGCDRWQQLGLGSGTAGSTGYTWQNGRIWQSTFQPTPHIAEVVANNGGGHIRDVALGGDHTLVLSSDRRTVVALGKGGDGQLGLVRKPFVSAAVKSKKLSTEEAGNDSIAAVCAVDACSMAIGDDGQVLRNAGKCRDSKRIQAALSKCIQRAAQDGLLDLKFEENAPKD